MYIWDMKTVSFLAELAGLASLGALSMLTGCATAPPPPVVIAVAPQKQPDPAPAPTTTATTPDQSAAATTQPTATAQPVTPSTALVDFAPPSGLVWIERQGNFALAGEKDPSESGRCEVWNVQTKQRTAQLTSHNTVAGGATPGCVALSPAGQLVQYGNGRRLVWKNLSDQVTACVGVVAPDDATCVEDDVTPFSLAGKAGDAANLDLHWSRAVVNGATKKVTTIKRGLNRDGGDPKWWTVQYCSPEKAVIDITGGDRIVVDARTGAAKAVKRTGAPCP